MTRFRVVLLMLLVLGRPGVIRAQAVMHERVARLATTSSGLRVCVKVEPVRVDRTVLAPQKEFRRAWGDMSGLKIRSLAGKLPIKVSCQLSVSLEAFKRKKLKDVLDGLFRSRGICFRVKPVAFQDSYHDRL